MIEVNGRRARTTPLRWAFKTEERKGVYAAAKINDIQKQNCNANVWRRNNALSISSSAVWVNIYNDICILYDICALISLFILH